MADISCIIVTFNSQKVIRECLESILRDIDSLLGEIIVVDNNSIDDTIHIINSVKYSDRCTLKVIQNHYNFGYTRAINQGLAASNGSFLVLLNPDTVLHSGFFGIVTDTLNKNRDYGIAAPQHLSVDSNIIPSCRKFPTPFSTLPYVLGLNLIFPKNKVMNGWKMGYFDHNTPAIVDQPMGACLVTRREDFLNVGYFDERFTMFFSDVDWCKRMKLNGKKAFFLTEAKITHHYGLSVKQQQIKMIVLSHRAFLQYFRKYFRGIHWIVPNTIVGVLLYLSVCPRVVYSILKR